MILNHSKGVFFTLRKGKTAKCFCYQVMNGQASCVRAGKKDVVGPKEQWPRLFADTLRSGHSPSEVYFINSANSEAARHQGAEEELCK